MSVNIIAASLRSLWDKVSFQLSMESHDKAVMGWHEKEWQSRTENPPCQAGVNLGGQLSADWAPELSWTLPTLRKHLGLTVQCALAASIYRRSTGTTVVP